MAIVVTPGKYGLFYGTDTANAAVFVAAETDSTAQKLVTEARDGLLEGTVVLPLAKDQTPKQRQETIGQLTKHLHKDKH